MSIYTIRQIAEIEGLQIKDVQNFTQRYPVPITKREGGKLSYCGPMARLIIVGMRLSHICKREVVHEFVASMQSGERSDFLYFSNFSWHTSSGFAIDINIEAILKNFQGVEYHHEES